MHEDSDLYTDYRWNHLIFPTKVLSLLDSIIELKSLYKNVK